MQGECISIFKADPQSCRRNIPTSKKGTNNTTEGTSSMEEINNMANINKVMLANNSRVDILVLSNKVVTNRVGKTITKSWKN